jgi:hypothetical protein
LWQFEGVSPQINADNKDQNRKMLRILLISYPLYRCHPH